MQAYLGSDSEDDGQDGQAEEAISIEEYRRRLLAGAGAAAERKGGKDWGPAEVAAQASPTALILHRRVALCLNAAEQGPIH